jgi:hypothetical protein
VAGAAKGGCGDAGVPGLRADAGRYGLRAHGGVPPLAARCGTCRAGLAAGPLQQATNKNIRIVDAVIEVRQSFGRARMQDGGWDAWALSWLRL